MQLKGYVYARPHDHMSGEVVYQFHELSPDDGPWQFLIEQGWTPLSPYTLEFDAIDPRALIEGQVVSLLARKQKLESDFKSEVRKVDDAIANLRCLEFTANTGA